MTRSPVRSGYDAVLDFTPARGVPEAAYVLVKQSYEVRARRCERRAPAALLHDLRDPNLEPKLPAGSDFWIQKAATDVVVRGSAYAPEQRPVSEMHAAVSVRDTTKRVRVCGERLVRWYDSGHPYFPAPELFTEMPLTYDNAYGGIDPRLPMAPPESPEAVLHFDLFDYPGLYPRNFHGKGYAIERGPWPGLQLPNLENPADLLTAERLIVGDPALWHRQPLPWCFDRTHALMFPRMAYLGLAPCFRAPPDPELAEIKAGFLPLDFAERYRPEFDAIDALPAAFYQEASLGMQFDELCAGTPIVIEGMHPEREHIMFTLPEPPAIALAIDGTQVPAAISLSQCVITPAELRVDLTYVAIAIELPRVLIPGVHKHIPFQATIDGDEPVIYATPQPALERLQEGAT